MPRPVSKLKALDAAAAGIQTLNADGTFGLGEGGRLIVKIETASSGSGLSTMFEISAGLLEGRLRRPSYHWRNRGRKFSTVLRTFVKNFPKIVHPPTEFQMVCRGSQIGSAVARQLILDALAEAIAEVAPQPTRPAVASETKVETEPGSAPVDWAAVLRGGADGLRRWNRLKAAERKAVDLAGAALGGLDLGAASFRGVSAKRASFAGSNLAEADFSDGVLDWADFASAGLESARFKGVRAPEAVFRGAKLARADLSRGFFAGATFAGADLAGADLSGANIHNVDFTGASLDGIVLEGASFDARTGWPANFPIPAEVVFAGRGTDPRLSGKGKKAVATDVSGLIARLRSTIDPKRMKRTIDMLKAGRNQLFSEVDFEYVRGIVRSQTEDDLYYSCVLTADGTYSCSTPTLSPCLGLRGEPCKHILVLLIGLARAGLLEPATIDPWILASRGKPHRWNKTTVAHVSESLLRYKCVQAGEVDWRPTETIPEDFYAMREARTLDEFAELREALDRLHAALDDLVVRGVRAAAPREIGRLSALRAEFHAAGAGHLAGRLATLAETIQADDRAAAPALLRAMTALRLFDRMLTLEVAAVALAAALLPDDPGPDEDEDEPEEV